MPKRTKPKSPPAKIEVGLGTKLGLTGIAGAIVTLIADFLARDDLGTPERVAIIIVAGVIATAVIVSRGRQAEAVELARARPAIPAVLSGLGELTSGGPRTGTGASFYGQTRDDGSGDDLGDAGTGEPEADQDVGGTITDHGPEIGRADGGPDDQHDLHDRSDVPPETWA